MKNKILFIIIFIHGLCFGNIQIPVVNGENTAPLGKGYNSERDHFRGECVKGTHYFEGKQESNFGLSQTLSQKSLSDELGFSAGFKVKTGVTSHKGSAKFLRSTAESGHSISSTFYSNYSFKDTYLKNPTLTDMAKDLLKNPERFKKACGDHFILRKSTGAKLFYNIKIEFASKKSKEVFQANYNFKGSFASAYANLKKSRSNFSKRTSVQFSAVQLGGDVSKLTELIASTSTDSDNSSAFAFVDCSFGDFSKCDDVMKAALVYATDTEEGFPSQINKTTDDGRGGAASFKYLASDYESLGVFIDLPREVNFMIQSIRKRLSSMFDELFNQATKTENILSSSVIRLTTEQRKHFLEMKNDLDSRVELVASAIYNCYQYPLDCKDIKKNLIDDENISKLYTEKDFTIEKLNFSQFCDFSKSLASSKELRLSINSLITKAKELEPHAFRSNTSNMGVDECYVAQSILESQKKLDLSSLGISDLRPLEKFIKLDTLNLSFNQIKDIRALLKLKNLVDLNLSANNINSVRGMSELNNLERLNISTNNLIDVDELKTLSNLVRLDIRNNASELSCPLVNESKCIRLDIRGKVQAFPIISSVIETPRLGHQSIKVGKSVLTLGGFYKEEMRKPEHGMLEAYNAQDFSYIPFEDKNIAQKSFIYHKMLTLGANEFLAVGGLNSSSLYHFILDRGVVKLLNQNLMSSVRVDHTLVKVGDEVHIIGGWKKGIHYWNPREATRNTEVYNFNDKVLKKGASLNIPRAGHTSTLLDDGRILVVGGFNLGGKSINTAEIYDPATGKYTLLGSFLKTGRAFHQAIKAKNGKVFLIGGYLDSNVATNTIEIFDPKTNTFSSSFEHLNIERADFQALTIASGHILIAGGARSFSLQSKDSTCENCEDSVEIYDPISQSITVLKASLTGPKANFTLTAIDEDKLISIGGPKDYLRDEIYSIITLIGLK